LLNPVFFQYPGSKKHESLGQELFPAVTQPTRAEQPLSPPCFLGEI